MFVTIIEFSKLTGLGQDFVRKLCRSADFPVLHCGRKYMIDRDAAIQYMKDKAAFREYVRTKTVTTGRGKKAVG